ncbi:MULTISPECIES: SH3 domain-containing protein [unclassified Amycolatopsis]|uniref:SH3 domain-containing protein n=1 Tax=unclassified Amycolatopsis TaxID=2618356 RepID=UPI002E12167A|nr:MULTISPECIES: SH3 domain-containing protein [unclassified Amycolatopsis]WSJ76091.1 SH3 domain-containing protein [Amycolatopsis sp. NBC_01307]WSK80304.1 SH3 domain-containing protein [Amycolatopsis sp. NBC_01286]
MSKKTLIIVGAIVAVIVIYALNTNKQASAGASATGCKVTVIADVLNARESADGNAKVVGKYLRDAQFDALPGVQNGFRKVADDKWVAAAFTEPVAGSAC